MSYTEYNLCQREIAEQYKKCNLELLLLETRNVLSEIGVEVTEDGTHEVLAKAGGMYQRLWDHQAGGFVGEDV